MIPDKEPVWPGPRPPGKLRRPAAVLAAGRFAVSYGAFLPLPVNAR